MHSGCCYMYYSRCCYMYSLNVEPSFSLSLTHTPEGHDVEPSHDPRVLVVKDVLLDDQLGLDVRRRQKPHEEVHDDSSNENLVWAHVCVGARECYMLTFVLSPSLADTMTETQREVSRGWLGEAGRNQDEDTPDASARSVHQTATKGGHCYRDGKACGNVSLSFHGTVIPVI